MNATQKIPAGTNSDLQLAFDVGHSSIGWAVLKKSGKQTSDINILGCGAVVFRADDCLASSRRTYRRQRRHIRSTRQRIARMKILLKHMGVLSRAELNKPRLRVAMEIGRASFAWRKVTDMAGTLGCYAALVCPQPKATMGAAAGALLKHGGAKKTPKKRRMLVLV